MYAALACVVVVATIIPARAGSRSASVAAATPPPPDLVRFFKYDRKADYGSVKTQVQVPMRDGKHLGCWLYTPTVKGTSTPARGRFPGLINNFTPYAIAYPFGIFHGEYFAQHGYLNLECTPRGTGLSEGVFAGWMSAIENRDNYDLIEWLAHQPNSTGKIGQEGNSYGGMTAYRVASLHPPSLVTIAPQQSFSSLYRNYAYPGGIRSLGDPYWWAFAGSVGFGRPSVSTQEAEWLRHPLLDDYWRQIDIDTKWDQIDIPVLGFGGWIDIFQDAMPENYLALAGPNTYLIDGPWDHGNTFDSTVTLGALLAWFDHWLYGSPDAPLPPTHVASYVMPSGPWVALPSWPPQARNDALALTTTGTLSGAAGRAGQRSYTVNTAAGAVDLQSGDHLLFTGAPLPGATTISGAGSVRLLASLSDPSGVIAASQQTVDTGQGVDTNFVVRLDDVSPSGDHVGVTRGYLKASHLRSHSYPAHLPLDVPVEYDVPLWHVHYTVAAGHHLELLLESGDKECCLSSAPAVVQPLFPLTVTVRTGAGGSVLSLPLQD